MLQRSDELFIVALFITISVAIYLIPLKKREPIKLRIGLSFAVMLILNVFVEYFLGSSILGNILKVIYWLVIISVIIFICTKSSKSAALYVAIWSIVTAQFIYILWFSYTSIRKDVVSHWNYGWLILIIFYAIMYLIIGLTIARIMPDNGVYSIGPRQLTSATALMIVFEIIYLSIINSNIREQDFMMWASIILAQFYCISMLYFQMEIFKKSAIEKELLTTNILRKKQKSQYDLTKENIELINRKTHDLKHQVAAIREVADEEEKEKYISEVENSVRIYDSIVRTGNEVLDTILTDKSLYCNANGIQINSVVDGSKLAFIDTVDLYTILGNAIDNAIEGVKQFKENDKRLIDISIYHNKNFLVISIVNPIKEELKFKEGLPVSIKPKDGYHGYGLKSIKRYVKKYDGHMNLSVENKCFVLKIVIPLQDV